MLRLTQILCHRDFAEMESSKCYLTCRIFLFIIFSLSLSSFSLFCHHHQPSFEPLLRLPLHTLSASLFNCFVKNKNNNNTNFSVLHKNHSECMGEREKEEKQKQKHTQYEASKKCKTQKSHRLLHHLIGSW